MAQLVEPDAGLADEALADQPGKAEAEKRQRQPGRHLVGDERQREKAEEQRHRHAGEDARQESPERASR